MKNKYLAYQEKLARFNQWELDQLKSLSIQKKLNQFSALFQLQDFLSPETREELHSQHLISLSYMFREVKSS